MGWSWNASGLKDTRAKQASSSAPRPEPAQQRVLRFAANSVLLALPCASLRKRHRCERLVAGKDCLGTCTACNRRKQTPSLRGIRHRCVHPSPATPHKKTATHKLATRRVRRRGARSREARGPCAKTGTRPHYAIPSPPYTMRVLAHDAVIISTRRHAAGATAAAAAAGRAPIEVRLAPPAP